MISKTDRSIRALELDKVLALLAEKASLSEGKEACLQLTPSYDYNEVASLLKNTEDAYLLIAKFGTPSFGFAENCNSYLTTAAAGGSLSMAALLKIGELLRVIRSVKTWCEASAGISTTLDGLFSALYPNKYFEDKIFFSIKSEDEMNDNASSELAEIRRKLKNSAANIKSRLDKIIRSSSSAQYLQDAIVTQRQGRFVVPVKAEYKGQIPGLVHDTSSSGATLFVEPMAVVEINNEIRVLQAKEKDEIDRILSALSVEAASFSEGLKRSYRALVELDICFAKANLGYSMRASMPLINKEGRVYLKKARHPLILPKTVVPITVSLGKDYSVLVITGPNTGGKTVSLKTVGLFTLMAATGLMLPADDNSEIAVFDGVFADIGDEQSIEQSLSTFSSHMNHIISILDKAGDNTLVLFDELCSGTDPIEGAALSTAILTELIGRGSTVVATTHYAELKAFALETKGVENACCEFDVETLRPTYRLMIGIPGRSNAFAISSRLGLENSIVELAKGLVSEENKQFEKVVSKLENAYVEAERDRNEIALIKSQLAEAKKSASQRLNELQIERDKMLQKARDTANDIIETARNNSSRLLNELEEMKKQLNKQNTAEMAEKARRLAKQTIKGMEERVDGGTKPTDNFTPEEPSRPLRAGDTVEVRGFSKEATVDKVSEDGKTVFVVIGALKTKVSAKDVKLKSKAADRNKPRTRNVRGLTPKSQREAKRELDIRGFASDEGLMEVDRFIDEAVLAGVETVFIIHGKGTGVLKKAVRAHLKGHPSVVTYRPGVFGEGEDGVTVAEIK